MPQDDIKSPLDSIARALAQQAPDPTVEIKAELARARRLAGVEKAAEIVPSTNDNERISAEFQRHLAKLAG